jgi:hypothetical protein
MRHLLAAFLAAIAMFMWGFTAWAALDLYKFAFPTVGTSSESAIVSTLATELPEDGAYFVPHVPAGYGQGTEDPAKQAEFDSFETRMRTGPTALILFHKGGSEPMDPMEFVRGFAVEFVSALLMACVLSSVSGGFGRRAYVGFTIALFASTACFGVMGNFMHMPLAFIGAFWLDTIIVWTMCAVIIAWILPVRRTA